MYAGTDRPHQMRLMMTHMIQLYNQLIHDTIELIYMMIPYLASLPLTVHELLQDGCGLDCGAAGMPAWLILVEEVAAALAAARPEVLCPSPDKLDNILIASFACISCLGVKENAIIPHRHTLLFAVFVCVIRSA